MHTYEQTSIHSRQFLPATLHDSRISPWIFCIRENPGESPVFLNLIYSS